MKIKRFVAFYGYYLILFTVSCFIYGQDAVPGWKAGVAKTVITPGETVWMAGYANRTKPAEGKIHDLWAKALYLEDTQGNQVLLVTMDIESIPREISGRIKERLKAETGMEKEQIVLNCSHTHSGPVLKSDYMYVYLLDDRQRALIDNYTGWFEDKIVQLGKEAARRTEPVKVSAQNGTVRFQVNRRNNKESELTSLTPLQGPNDYSVPVLKVEDETGRIKAVVFGYACHATVLSGYEWCGDYPGFAQIELEKLYPGATAMFFQGAGADQNPLPRRSIPLAKQYGKELAAAVERVINEPMRELQPRLTVAYSEIQLDLGPIPTKKELKKYRKELTGYEKKWAENTLAKLKGGGSLPTAYPYPVQVWRLGNQTIVSLGGETLISYAIRLKELLGEDIFVMGYSNDVMAYIPSDEELLKGGYEIISSQRAFGLPAPWKAGLEEKIIDKVIDLANQTSMQTTISGFPVKTDVAYQELSENYCWFHLRATAIPGMGKNSNPTVIMTIQKELQDISDFYSGLYYMRTDDLGETWTKPIEISELKW
ncbi:MAG: neutral/alkaline non-lysosomal ceramidase N-terminal domain-containing protein [Bacteroidales bacterium]|jgi:neutral ceramidase